jgi:hypothetical protein
MKTTSKVAVTGVMVRPPGRCRCGAELATIDASGTELRCSACSALRGRLSQATLGFITESIRLFDIPTQPIIIRRGGV